MKRLTYNTLKELNYSGYLLENAPERILQFGEGNFLRAFADYFIDIMNEKAGFHSKVVLCQPVGNTRTAADRINAQEGLYTLFLRGMQNGKKTEEQRIISCVSRCLNPRTDYAEVLGCAANPDLRFIISNTTDAGIVYDPSCQFTDIPASSYPGKLTQFLYRRFQEFHGDTSKGFFIFSCELIDENGKELKRCVLKYARQWKLGEEFISWIDSANLFCSTLVDRIASGYPAKEAKALWQRTGYQDELLDTAEPYALWVIEGPESIKKEFPAEQTQLPILFTEDLKPYKQRKVRILNGAHTSFVLGAYLAGQNLVRECMEDEVIRSFMNQTIYEEIMPTLPLPEKELKEFAEAVVQRFQNSFIDHALLDISMNSTSKWKARLLPSLKEYIRLKHSVPPCIATAFAFYIAFYNGHTLTPEGLLADRAENSYTIRDTRPVLEFYLSHKDDSVTELVHAVCSNTAFWGEELTALPGFEDAVCTALTAIREKGTYQVMADLLR